MNYTEFQNTFKSQFLIQKKDIIGAFPRFDQKNLTYWQKKGYLKKIINKFYTFSNISFDRDRIYGVSNCLCDPSYVSSFQALDYYGFIPEQVAAITAVTTHITRKHTTFLGIFSYQSIKPELFWGYVIIQHKYGTFFIADPEKTILDFFYLNPQYGDRDDILGLRFNWDVIREKINKETLLKYSKIYPNKRVQRVIQIFLSFF